MSFNAPCYPLFFRISLSLYLLVFCSINTIKFKLKNTMGKTPHKHKDSPGPGPDATDTSEL